MTVTRVYSRTDDPKSPYFAVCYDGNNKEEVVALLNVNPADEFWVELPAASPTIRLINTVGTEPLTVLNFTRGDWAVSVGANKYADADFVAAFSLADAALAP